VRQPEGGVAAGCGGGLLQQRLLARGTWPIPPPNWRVCEGELAGVYETEIGSCVSGVGLSRGIQLYPCTFSRKGSLGIPPICVPEGRGSSEGNVFSRWVCALTGPHSCPDPTNPILIMVGGRTASGRRAQHLPDRPSVSLKRCPSTQLTITII
jgi:hypothetical protein